MGTLPNVPSRINFPGEDRTGTEAGAITGAVTEVETKEGAGTEAGTITGVVVADKGSGAIIAEPEDGSGGRFYI
jgi:hypothetical protein